MTSNKKIDNGVEDMVGHHCCAWNCITYIVQ